LKAPFHYVARFLLRLSKDEALFVRRGFRGNNPAARERLEAIGRTFIGGYNLALDEEHPGRFPSRFKAIDLEDQGFAYEGAAMAFAVLDCLAPDHNQRLTMLLNGPGAAHAYMVHVGAGWAMARLPWLAGRLKSQFDPLLRWLALDGYGFHQGYFEYFKYVDGLYEIPRLSGYARRAFDQGLGRSLWFVEGADCSQIAMRILSFPTFRRGDIWSGVGLACAYAGGVNRSELEALRELGGCGFQPHLAQGAAFAAKARQRAGNPSPQTDLACEILCGITADHSARVTDEAMEGLPNTGDEEVPPFETWRTRIRTRFSRSCVIT